MILLHEYHKPLLSWINFNPIMDKWLHTFINPTWNYLPISKPYQRNHWSSGIYKLSPVPFYCAWYYLSMLGLKLLHVSMLLLSVLKTTWICHHDYQVRAASFMLQETFSMFGLKPHGNGIRLLVGTFCTYCPFHQQRTAKVASESFSSVCIKPHGICIWINHD